LDWWDYVMVDERFFRPAEIYALKGDYSKDPKKLGWRPTVSFVDLVRLMVEADLALVTGESR
jgi:GDPmannose 4,6-dehydratase